MVKQSIKRRRKSYTSFAIVIVMIILSCEINGVCLGDKIISFMGLPTYVNGFHIIVIVTIVLLAIIGILYLCRNIYVSR